MDITSIAHQTLIKCINKYADQRYFSSLSENIAQKPDPEDSRRKLNYPFEPLQKFKNRPERTSFLKKACHFFSEISNNWSAPLEKSDSISFINSSIFFE